LLAWSFFSLEFLPLDLSISLLALLLNLVDFYYKLTTTTVVV